MKQLIWQQVKDGALQPVESSDWVIPIIIVKKKDDGIRICTDFKMTVNSQLHPKTYLLPYRVLSCCLYASTSIKVINKLQSKMPKPNLVPVCSTKHMFVNYCNYRSWGKIRLAKYSWF